MKMTSEKILPWCSLAGTILACAAFFGSANARLNTVEKKAESIPAVELKLERVSTDVSWIKHRLGGGDE